MNFFEISNFRTESNPIDPTTNRARQQTVVPIQPSHISPEELQFIQNTLPTWLTEVEAKCASKNLISTENLIETTISFRYSRGNSTIEK